MKYSSTRGTPYRSVRHLDNQTVAVDATPERAVEHSLGAAASVPRASASVDAARATAFKPSKASNAEDRIGVKGRSD